MKRSQPLRSSSRLPARSARRIAEQAERDAVREETLRRAGWRCEAKDLVPEVRCWGPLDCDERAPRGIAPGSHLDLNNTQALCRAHHEWKHSYPEEAHDRGLRLWAYEYHPNQGDPDE